MITLCWSAKGGSGTTTVAAAMALANHRPTLLVDLAGDVALALGLALDDRPTLTEWFASDAPSDRLAHIQRAVNPRVDVLPASASIDRTTPGERWRSLAAMLRAVSEGHGDEPRDVVVDAGLGAPAPALAGVADHSLLVTKRCYLSLMQVSRLAARPTGIVVLDEPGRALGVADVEVSIGAPVVATMLYDPKIARAIDAGLGVSRLPNACLRELRAVG